MPLSPTFDISQAHVALAESLAHWSQAACELFEGAGLARIEDLDDATLLSYRLPVKGACAMSASLAFVSLSGTAGLSHTLAWVIDCDDEACGDALGILLEFCPVYSAGARTALPLLSVQDQLQAHAPSTVLDWVVSTLETCGVSHGLVLGERTAP